VAALLAREIWTVIGVVDGREMGCGMVGGLLRADGRTRGNSRDRQSVMVAQRVASVACTSPIGGEIVGSQAGMNGSVAEMDGSRPPGCVMVARPGFRAAATRKSETRAERFVSRTIATTPSTLATKP
jgi:hypothetical protein